MPRKMLIDASHPEETRVVVVDGQRVDQFDFETITKKQIAGNVYLARVTRVEPSLQAAFVEYGGNRHGFLPFSEIHPDYYQIPHADRAALLADAARAYQEEAEERPARESRNGGRGRDDRNGGRGRNGGREVERAGSRDGSSRREAEAFDSGAEDAVSGDADSGAQGGREESRNDGGRRGRGRGRGRDRRRNDSRGGWVEVLEREVTLEDGGSARLLRLERRAAEAQESEAREPAEAPAAQVLQETGPGEAPLQEEGAVREVTLEDGTVARLSEPDERKGPAQAMAASPDDSTSGEGTGGRRARYLRRRRPGGGKGRGKPRDENGAEPRQAAEEAPEVEEIEFVGLDSAREDQGEAENAEAFEVESVGEEDSREEAEASSPRRFPRGRYKIQEVIKKRQILLVQVVKEERGTKGAALTTYVSLAGRYCVLMPNTARGGGISRKITEAADRKRLKEAADELDVPKGMGLIVRTAGADRTKAEIKRDYDYLIRQWTAVRDLTLASMAPKLVYEEGDLIKRSLRDLYSRDIEEIVVEGDDGYREAKDFMKMLTPSHAKNVKPYRDDVPLFIRHQVESQLTAMFNPIVQLRSGGYIVINITEALVAVDVNSGRSTREYSIEDTALKTNLEAAEELARQMRLRDLAGLIVIDFIDMDDPRNDRAVERKLKDCLKNDRARMQIGRISNFGLLEMSRQRLRPGMLEASTKPCPHCQGVGHVRSDESLALSILREAEEAGVREPGVGMKIVAPVSIANYLINHKRERLLSLEKRYALAAHVEGDPSLPPAEHRLERFLLTAAIRTEAGPVGIDSSFADAEEEEIEARAEPRRIEIETPRKPVPTEEPRSDEELGEAPAPEAEARFEPREERGGRRGRNERRPRGDRAPEARQADPLPVIDLGGGEESGSILAPEFPAPSAPESGEGRGRRARGKGGRRGEERRPQAEEAAPGEAEAVAPEAAPEPGPSEDFSRDAATALLSRPDALDLAAGKLFAEAAAEAEAPRIEAPAEAAAPVEAAEAPKPARPRRAPRAAKAPKAAAPAPAPLAEAVPEPAPAPEPAAKPASVAESAPAAESEPAPEPDGPARPKRSGWWSRG
ncbi:Rne/Rng family ribonuclease [Neomegalonema sp.]|uniref:Rne/Rng family ribonuclease n=1 Tax=Neomegalonema sp. TaxID=2039713 RepID=UPI0026067D2B|nr:Rne/Rng family ribonuclease [Neomegalonema sp.]MDD2867659.1 Rne/Rng family ribonuclease [Neomegalonema sp.]